MPARTTWVGKTVLSIVLVVPVAVILAVVLHRSEPQRQTQVKATPPAAQRRNAAQEIRERQRAAVVEQWTQQREQIVQGVREDLRAGRGVEALRKIDKFQGFVDQELEALRPEATRIATTERERAQKAARKLGREQFGKLLRTKYLDDGLDIKVAVTGRESDTLKLTFPLFNDVWSHRMQKGDVLTTAQSLGFRRVEMSDGYQWGYYWDLQKR